jgi:hypothetical protein
MKKQIGLVFLFSLVSGLSYTQIIFEKGYLINDSNQRIECLIKNMQWKNNPTELQFKLSENETIQKISVDSAKEFGIGDDVKFISARVKIDRSLEQIYVMSSESMPIFHEEQLFLRAIIEGKASLYSYMDGNLARFFYKMEDSEIKQLVFKSYLIENNNNFSIRDKKIGQNVTFRQQLLNDLNCQTINRREFEILNYNKRDLKKIFLKYNGSTDSLYTNYNVKKKSNWFDLSLRPGLNCSSFNFQNMSSKVINVAFDKDFSFRFGIETQFILPFNKNKWSILFEPTYQYYNSETTTEIDGIVGGILTSKVKYQSLQLAAGVRHLFFLNNNSKIFLNASYVHDFSSNSSINQTRLDGSTSSSLEIKPTNCLALGAGYQYKNRYGIEMRYYTKRDLLIDYLDWNSDFTTFAVIFEFTLF